MLSLAALLAAAGVALAPGAWGAEATESEPAPAPVPTEVEKPSVGHKLLFYIPNRLLDLVDVLRLRLRVGPGAAFNLRPTSRLAFFGGSYKSVYVGLPGPRAPKKFVSPVGREDAKGIIFAGVDATDDVTHPPGYLDSEMVLGVQALVVGGDVGIDFVEIADFVTGLVLIDLRKDDL